MSDTKLVILLATALFLISAPEPDSATIAEMTANFVVPTSERALLAADRDVSEAAARQTTVQPQRASAEIDTSEEDTDVGESSVDPG